jgi:pimeloyl-ACP methyl ester carboxylesterase
MATIVLAHGAWSSAWAWARMRPLMREAGHDFYAPSLTGLGDRAHLAHPLVDLETHIRDVCAVIETEELQGVVVLGHSYGGMVATGVADRLRERVVRVIYLDAFVPRNGECLFDLLDPEDRLSKEQAAARDGHGWLVPPNPIPPDTPETDHRWLIAHRRWQPIETLRQPIRLSSEPGCPRDYIHALRKPPADPFGQFAARARSEPGWTCRDIDASHGPNVTAPALLMRTIEEILIGE